VIAGTQSHGKAGEGFLSGYISSEKDPLCWLLFIGKIELASGMVKSYVISLGDIQEQLELCSITEAQRYECTLTASSSGPRSVWKHI